MRHFKSLLATLLTISIVVTGIFTGTFTKAATYTASADTTESEVYTETVDLSNTRKWNFGKYWNASGTELVYNLYKMAYVDDIYVEEGCIVSFNTGNSSYKFIVRAVNSDTNTLVKNFGTVANDTQITIPAGCNALRVSIFNSVNEKSTSVYGNYCAMANGTIKPYMILKVVLSYTETAATPEATSTPVPTATNTPVPTATNTPVPTATNTPVPTATNTPVPTATNTPVPTATSTPVPTTVANDYSSYETLDQVFSAMIINFEQDYVDISRFKTKDTASAWQKAIDGDAAIAYISYQFVVYIVDGNGSYYDKVKLVSNSDGYADRYDAVKASVDEAMSLIQDGMSDLEKALVLHDYIVDKTTYDKSADYAYSAAGVLAYGRAVCSGYSAAYTFLLKQAGLEAKENTSSDMNHIWTVVKIDGNWYQVDATWDDTRMSKTGKHYYFLRTDDEFQNTLSSKHYNYYVSGTNKTQTIDCSDTTYTNWFVHDVKGAMVYSEGYWYYADGNNLMKAHIDGSDMQVVAEESNTVAVVKAENGVVTYKVNGTNKTTDQ